MDSIYKPKQSEYSGKLLFYLRGYFVPLVGAIIIILVLIFIYVPNIQSIFTDISRLQDDNTKYNQIKDRISYFKSLSTTDQQSLIANNIVQVDQFLPDIAKNADSVNTLQTLAQSDGLQVIAGSGEVSASDDFTKRILALPQLAVSELTFQVSGTSDQVQKYMSDITNLKQLMYVSSVSINGDLSSGKNNQVNLTTTVFTMNAADLVANLNLLTANITPHSAAEVNSL